MTLNNYSASVVVTSDTRSHDPTQDKSGQLVVDALKDFGFSEVTKYIIPDDRETITRQLKSILNNDSNNVLIITVGGTGLSPRDVTPEASCAIYDKSCDGIRTGLIMNSLRYSPRSALSRLTAGISGKCLIVNFPGSLQACRECFAYLKQFLGHAIDEIRSNTEEVRKTHLLKNISPPSSCSSKSMTPDLDKQPLSSSLLTASELIQSLDLRCQKSKDCPCDSSSENNLIQLEGANESAYPLIDYNDALRIMNNVTLDYQAREIDVDLTSTSSLETTYSTSAPDCALGSMLAENVTSKNKIPPYSVSTMDGYVCHFPKLVGRLLSNIGLIHAKLVTGLDEFEKLRQDPDASETSFCYQVNTGERVPASDIVVVPFEETEKKLSEGTVKIMRTTQAKYYREQGSDLDQTYVMKAGTVIGPIQLALLLSMGYSQVRVFKMPVIGILSTGDELIESPIDCLNSKVVDTNNPLLHSFFLSRGYYAKSCGIAKDTQEDVVSKLEASLEKCDVLIVTGGASMGTKDFVKDAIKKIGGTIHFGRVNIKPGKPVSFAKLERGDETKFIFSLPGNPVSAYITSLVLVVPFIERISRKTLPTIGVIGELVTITVDGLSESNGSYEFDGRYEFIRARFVDNSNNTVEVVHPQQSSCMRSLEDCNCLMLIDPSMKGRKLVKGESYRAIDLRR